MPRPVRRLAVLSAFLFATSLPAFGQALPSAPDSTCAAIAGIVRASGAAVIRTGPNLYDRYVVAPTFCEVKQFGLPVYVRTRDNPACLIGYQCRASHGGQ